MVLYFFNSLSSTMLKEMNLLILPLKVLTYPSILGNIKTNGRYLEELLLVSIDFDITIL